MFRRLQALRNKLQKDSSFRNKPPKPTTNQPAFCGVLWTDIRCLCLRFDGQAVVLQVERGNSVTGTVQLENSRSKSIQEAQEPWEKQCKIISEWAKLDWHHFTSDEACILMMLYQFIQMEDTVHDLEGSRRKYKSIFNSSGAGDRQSVWSQRSYKVKWYPQGWEGTDQISAW